MRGHKVRLSAFASVKLTIALLSLIAACILVGAWCPQESQVGLEKVVETFGAENAAILHKWGITDLFHTPFFLALIALITVNMIACSVQRVFPKARMLKQSLPFLGANEIGKMSVKEKITLKCPAAQALNFLNANLQKQGFKTKRQDLRLTGEWAKLAILAATVTHIGLLLLLTGVTITSWTGFNGFKPVPLGALFNFSDSEHSKLWIGKLPDWKLRVDDTRREDYESGDPKQWYTKLSVISKEGKILKQQEISVNNPLSFDGVDVYQSSWGLEEIKLAFNGRETKLPLRQMGGAHAAFMPLDSQTIMIFSLRGADKPLRVFAKIPEWKEPKILCEIPRGHEAKFGQVNVAYLSPIPVTGLQYKCDPGLPITYTAFGIIMTGVMMAAFPHRQLWASAVETGDGRSTLHIGGTSRKARTAFQRKLGTLASLMKDTFGEDLSQDTAKDANLEDNDVQDAQVKTTAV